MRNIDVIRKKIIIPYCPHSGGQRDFHYTSARHRILACGSRWGKDRASVNELVRIMVKLGRMERPESLIPKVHAWVVAPTFPLARQFWREMRTFIPEQLVAKFNESEKTVKFKDGGLIEVRSADKPLALVGVGLDVLVITEAALIPSQAWEVALRPRLSSPGRLGISIINGTPKGRNWLWRLFVKGQDPDEKEFASWNHPTSANPYIDAEEIEKAKHEMTDRWFRQEYLAEFIDDAGGVFRGVRSRILDALSESEKTTRFVIGCDWGRYEDFSVFTVLMIRRNFKRHVVEIQRINQLDYIHQIKVLSALVKKYRPFRTILEVNGVGDPVFSMVEQELGRLTDVQGFLTTNTSKQQIVEALALAIEREEISYPEIPVMVNELEAFEATQLRSGRINYSAPSGMHDDCVISLSLANWASVAAGSFGSFDDIPGGQYLVGKTIVSESFDNNSTFEYNGGSIANSMFES